MSQINIDFRNHWNKKYPEIPCWVNPEDEKKEFRPIKQLYDEATTDLTFARWKKSKQYNDYQLDFCLVKYKLAVEFDGHGQFSHQGKGIERDRRKSNLLQILGWNVLRYSSMDLKNNRNIVEEEIFQCLLKNFEVPEEIRDKYGKFLR